MGCAATVWTHDRKRCLMCGGATMTYDTPCPKAAEHRKQVRLAVDTAVACAEAIGATEFRFRTNGGSLTAHLMRLWLKNSDGWHPTEVAYMSDTDQPEIHAAEHALADLGLHHSDEWPTLASDNQSEDAGPTALAVFMATSAVVAAILLLSTCSA